MDELITVSTRSYEITPIGIRWTGPMTMDEGAKLGLLLQDISIAVPWCVGDWINKMETDFGEAASQILSLTGWTYSTLNVYRWVARSIPPENRRQGLPHAMHQLVAGKTLSEQKAFLDAAEAEKMTVSQGKRRLRELTGGGGTKWWALVEGADHEDAQRIVDESIARGRAARLIER